MHREVATGDGRKHRPQAWEDNVQGTGRAAAERNKSLREGGRALLSLRGRPGGSVVSGL